MDGIRVEPATTALLDQIEQVFDGGGDGPSCQCQWWMLPRAEWRSCTRTEKQARFERELADDISPGLIVFVGDEPAGWVRVGPRHRQTRLLNTRIVKIGTPPPLDDDGVWAITCLSVTSPHRGRGLTHLLIEAATAFADDHQATRIEAYPIDTAVAKSTNNDLYVGSVAQFERAGFTVTARPTPRRAVMTRERPVR